MSGLLDAARVGDLAKMQRLIGRGASVHEVDGMGENVLMRAIDGDHAPIVHWLLKEGGARISDVDREGWTALSMAFAMRREGIVKLLLEDFGANIHGEHQSVWNLLPVNLFPSHLPLYLLKVLVLLDDAPPNVVTILSQV
jgi:ankyrin repeat protein